MAKIHFLEENLKNMIAAGEVVERPSGIVKELVDNSIDAHAKMIEVRIYDGGIDAIEVVDNGDGMDATDAKMCFQRHATSKIVSEADLFQINTLGFRGEALPSIASVAIVDLTTSEGTVGSAIHYEYGNLISSAVVGCNKGTSLRVSGLFYKTPARLKHLKSNHYEQALVIDVINKFALGHPEIAFKLLADDKELISTIGDGRMLNTMVSIYGAEIAKNSFVIKGEDLDYQIQGMGVLPSYSRANKNYINVYINSRMIKSYALTKNIIAAYQHFMFEKRYPIISLNIQMDNQLVDVNVHPAKWEIRLSKQKQLELLIYNTVLACLNQNIPVYNVSETELSKKMPTNVNKYQPLKVQEKPLQMTTDFVATKPIEDEVIKKEIVIEPDTTNTIAQPVPSSTIEVWDDNEVSDDNFFKQLVVIGSLHGSYILAENPSGLYIIDQHAAAERYNYELFMQKMFQEISLQEMLMPLKLTVGKELLYKVDKINQDLQKIMVQYEPFGDSLIVRAIPLWMKSIADPKTLLADILDLYLNDNFVLNELTKGKIATKACKASIKFNHQLSQQEMQQVVKNLSKCENPYNCPHGRPTVIKFSNTDLERLFKR